MNIEWYQIALIILSNQVTFFLLGKYSERVEWNKSIRGKDSKH